MIDYAVEVEPPEEPDFQNDFAVYQLASFVDGKLRLSTQAMAHLAMLEGEISVVTLADENHEPGSHSILDWLPHFSDLSVDAISGAGVWVLGKPRYEDSRQIHVLFLFVKKSGDPEEDGPLLALASLLSSSL